MLVVVGCTGLIDDPSGVEGDPGSSPPGGGPGAPRMEGVVDPGETLARRLTRDEYFHTVEDLLGVRLTEADAALHPEETSTEGFTNTAVGLVVTADHAEGYWEIAERVAAGVELAALLDRHASCREDTAPCREAFVRSLGTLLFRRPPDDREASAFAELFDAAAAEGGQFEDGARLALEAMLQAPQFLYRLEVQRPFEVGVRAVSGYELATRLSYLVWSSAPDEALLAAAESGALDTPEGLADELDRMLADPRAQRATERFIRDWMELHRLDDVTRAGLDASLAQDLAASTTRFWQALVWEDRAPLATALSTDEAWLTPATAEWYGLTPTGTGLARYDTSGVPERIGLLTQPGVLTVMADRDVGGIVARGLFVMERVLCAEPLEPPPDLNLADFRSHLGPEATEREYSEDRLANGSCSGCHLQFDPLAYAFERFDGIGRYGLVSEHGRPLREDGEVLDAAGEPRSFGSVEEYVAILAGDARVQRCLTEKHVQLALGRPMEHEDEAWVAEIHDAQLGAGGTYDAMLRSIVAHPLFRAIRTEE